MSSTTKRSKTIGIPSQPYEEIDFAAAGMVATQEESKRLNDMRQIGLDVAEYLRQADPEGAFASLPAQFQSLVGMLVAVGAEPSHFVLNTSSDGTIHLFGIVMAPGSEGWKIFQASGRVGDGRDVDVTMRNLGVSTHEEGQTFDTIEEAVEVLCQIQDACTAEPDLVDRLEAGGRWLN